MFALDKRLIEGVLKRAKPQQLQGEIPTVKSIRNIITTTGVSSDFIHEAASPAAPVQVPEKPKQEQKRQVNWDEFRPRGVVAGEGPKKGGASSEYEPPSYNNYFEYDI